MRDSRIAAEGVVDGPEEGGPRSEDRETTLGQVHGEGIEVPGGLAEEAMEPAPMSVADVAAGEDDLGDIAVTMGEDPACDDDEREGLEGRGREDRRNAASKAAKEGVSSMGRLPCIGGLSRCQNPVKVSNTQADMKICSIHPLQKCETRTEEVRGETSKRTDLWGL